MSEKILLNKQSKIYSRNFHTSLICWWKNSRNLAAFAVIKAEFIAYVMTVITDQTPSWNSFFFQFYNRPIKYLTRDYG